MMATTIISSSKVKPARAESVGCCVIAVVLVMGRPVVAAAGLPWNGPQSEIISRHDIRAAFLPAPLFGPRLPLFVSPDDVLT